MTITESIVDIATPTGPMRCMVLRPAEEGRKYPGLVLYSEIFQITGPIHRTGAYLAGHGYIVVIPEIYHELESAGTVLAYDQAGADVGNADKFAKEVSRPCALFRDLPDHRPDPPDRRVSCRARLHCGRAGDLP